MNMIAFKYKLCGSCINHVDIINDLEVFLDSELHFQQHVGYIFL
jgi:hypothetical protein